MVDGIKEVLQFIGMILVTVGALLIMIPKRLGIWMMLVAQFVWAVWAFQGGMFFFLIQSLFLIPVNIIALYQWKKRGIK